MADLGWTRYVEGLEHWEPEDYPVTVTFGFASRQEFECFMSGLIDGWGENDYDVKWKKRDWRDETFFAVDVDTEE